MEETEPRLRIYLATGVIGCKCETCGWSAKTSYVRGETAHKTAQRVFGNHICPPRRGNGEDTFALASSLPDLPN